MAALTNFLCLKKITTAIETRRIPVELENIGPIRAKAIRALYFSLLNNTNPRMLIRNSIA
jgi:hypothetical protein